MKILIIDGDDAERAIVRQTLTLASYDITIIEAKTVEQALHEASAHTLDGILLDYHLPPSNGLNIMQALRASLIENTAIIITSQESDDLIALECINRGAQDFIPKNELSVVKLQRIILQAQQRFKIEQNLIQTQLQLKKIAETDSLTGISNRYGFYSQLRSSIQQAQRTNDSFALVNLDLNKFKSVNDTLGHGAGDELLKCIAKRLKSILREGDLLGRLGGDEFALAIHNIKASSALRFLAFRIIDSLKDPVDICGQTLKISMSMGIATYPENANSIDNLMRCADIAMYRSKIQKSQFAVFSTELDTALRIRRSLEQDLRVAIAKNELSIAYQPQFATAKSQVQCVEALLRWQHPDHGHIKPQDIILVATESNMLQDLHIWILHAICKTVKNIGIKHCELTTQFSLNCSLLEVALAGRHLKEAIDVYAISPALIEVEIDYTIATNDEALFLRQLDKLHEIGVSMALDHFGTNSAFSFNLLRNSTFDTLKFDPCLVQSTSTKDQKLLKAFQTFSQGLGFATVAGGIETAMQNQRCQAMQFSRLQGFHRAAPMTEQDLLRFLKAFQEKKQLEINIETVK